MTKNVMTENRNFMKCPDFTALMIESDQSKGLPQPPLDKVIGDNIIELPLFDDVVKTPKYEDILDYRRSIRAYSDEPVSQEQLAFLLWSTQGVQKVSGKDRYASFRPVPSGGARHPFEVYIAALNVEGLQQGLYHYLPFLNEGKKRACIEHIAMFDKSDIAPMLAGQKWAEKSALIMFFSCLPYRGEWRYSTMAHSVMLIDAGHVGQNAMLSACALGLGSCCIAAYNSKKCDEVLKLDGDSEYMIYAVTVGAVKE